MRAILLLLILLVVVAIGAVATGFIDINQTRSAKAPDVDATRNGIAASGGQAPRFEVDTGKIAVGSREATVKVPAIEVRPADQGQNAAATQDQVATTNATQR